MSRRQLLGLGFSPKGIEWRLRTGRLHRARLGAAPLRGIYAVGRPGLTREGRWAAAVLACGEGAVLSHLSAAALWGIAAEQPGLIDVSLRRPVDLSRVGLRVHRRSSLAVADLGRRLGIPLTSPVRTLLDVAGELPGNRLERAVNEADKHDLVDPEALRAALDSHAGEAGVRPLRKLLDRDTFVLSDEELEVRFRPLARAAGLPTPQTKIWLNGFEVDFFWPDLRLVIETDGLRYHRTPSAQAKDARRDQIHTAAGYTRLRFTHWQVRYEPGYVTDILTRTRRRLEA